MNRIDVVLAHIAEDCEDIQQFITGIDETQFMQSKLVIKRFVCL